MLCGECGYTQEGGDICERCGTEFIRPNLKQWETRVLDEVVNPFGPPKNKLDYGRDNKPFPQSKIYTILIDKQPPHITDKFEPTTKNQDWKNIYYWANKVYSPNHTEVKNMDKEMNCLQCGKEVKIPDQWIPYQTLIVIFCKECSQKLGVK